MNLVADYPLTAVVIALCTGFVLGWLFNSILGTSADAEDGSAS